MSSANTVESARTGASRIDDLACKALGDRRLPDAWVANQQRIVLLPTAQHLDRALHFGLAANERIYAPLSRLPIEVDAISFQGAFLFLRIRAVLRILESRASCSSSVPRGKRDVSEARDAWRSHG